VPVQAIVLKQSVTAAKQSDSATPESCLAPIVSSDRRNFSRRRFPELAATCRLSILVRFEIGLRPFDRSRHRARRAARRWRLRDGFPVCNHRLCCSTITEAVAMSACRGVQLVRAVDSMRSKGRVRGGGLVTGNPPGSRMVHYDQQIPSMRVFLTRGGCPGCAAPVVRCSVGPVIPYLN